MFGFGKKKTKGRAFSTEEQNLGRLTQMLERRMKNREQMEKIERLERLMNDTEQPTPPQQPQSTENMKGLLNELHRIKEVVRTVWGIDLDNLPDSDVKDEGIEGFLGEMIKAKMQQQTQQPPQQEQQQPSFQVTDKQALPKKPARKTLNSKRRK